MFYAKPTPLDRVVDLATPFIRLRLLEAGSGDAIEVERTAKTICRILGGATDIIHLYNALADARTPEKASEILTKLQRPPLGVSDNLYLAPPDTTSGGKRGVPHIVPRQELVETVVLDRYLTALTNAAEVLVEIASVQDYLTDTLEDAWRRFYDEDDEE